MILRPDIQVGDDDFTFSVVDCDASIKQAEFEPKISSQNLNVNQSLNPKLTWFNWFLI